MNTNRDGPASPAPLRAVSVDRWRPTTALFRSAIAALTLVVVAVLWRRPELLVLATPMAVVTTWSLLTRPERLPTLDEHAANPLVREGDATRWHGHVTDADRADLVVATLQRQQWIGLDPTGGVTSSPVDDGSASVSLALRSTRWGRRIIEPVHVMVMSPWMAFRCEMTTTHRTLVTLPQPAAFDTTAPMRPAEGLVGLHRSARPGDGSEFAGVRRFQHGDRIRRINWPRSLRSTDMHVNSTWADDDTHVALVLDITDDFGLSEGVDGRASSLDGAVRAAGAIAEHFTHRGDRVSLRTFGSTRKHVVAAGTGNAHLSRVLHALTDIRPAGAMRGSYRGAGTYPWARGGAELVVVLSPLIAPEALDRAVSLGRHGTPVIVVDTLPDDIAASDDPFAALAWRIRLLERRRETRLVEAAGIPVVRWRGPGSLDEFLRDATRRAHAPRLSAGWSAPA